MARARVVGFRRQLDLARAVGCTPQQLSNWTGRTKPPQQMRKGFDVALARALGTSRGILFTDYAKTPPEEAALAWGVGFELPPWEQLGWDQLNLRQQILAILNTMPDQYIAKVLDYTTTVKMAEMASDEASVKARIKRASRDPAYPPMPKPYPKRGPVNDNIKPRLPGT